MHDSKTKEKHFKVKADFQVDSCEQKNRLLNA